MLKKKIGRTPENRRKGAFGGEKDGRNYISKEGKRELATLSNLKLYSGSRNLREVAQSSGNKRDVGWRGSGKSRKGGGFPQTP